MLWLKWICVSVLGGLVLGCASVTATPAATLPPSTLPPMTLPHSMKGWELYSWQKDGEWWFDLAVGTNRIKSAEEIKSSQSAAPGTAPLGQQLTRLQPGEEIFWSARGQSEFALPPAEIVRQVTALCAARGLVLTVTE